MPTSTLALSDVVARTLAGAQIPGCSIAVFDREGLRWKAGYGLADVAGGRAATGDTVYRLFSGTKLFTAVAVMQLVEAEKLALDDRLGRHLPELAEVGDITVLDLLSHRSGLRDTLAGFLAVTLPGERSPTSAEALALYRLRRSGPPGTTVAYRNVGYAILGELITRVAGIEYREYVARNVLVPLGIDAAFGSTDALRERAATGYIRRWDPMRLVLRALFPGLAPRLEGTRSGSLVALGEYALCSAAIGGLVGAMPELGKLLVAQLGDGGGILSAASTRRMQTMVAHGAAGVVSREGIGLGWKFGRTAEHAFLNHEGGGAGFTSELRLYPHAGIGIAVGMNMMRMPQTMRAAHQICEAVLASRDAWP